MDALLVTSLPNIRYLCGFTGSAGALIVSRDSAAFFTDGRYAQQASQEVQSAQISTQGPPLAAARKWLAKQSLKKLGYDDAQLTVAAWEQLKTHLGRRIRLQPASGVVESLRMIKDDDEIRLLRSAAAMCSDVFNSCLNKIISGVAETSLAAELEFSARKLGAEGMSFETIVAGGLRSALPHGVASRQLLPRNGFVVLDFGVILAGYCSDMTRTMHLGRPSGKARRLYQAVLQAQLAAITAVRPGASAGSIDRAARRELGNVGLSKFFTHSTGHGVGLEIHERPRLAKGQRERLRPGMVITIEPGIYIPGECGIRIEDMVVVTANGCDALTQTTKELITG